MQYGVPRSRYGDLSPLEVARLQLRHVEELLAQHVEWLAAQHLPDGQRPQARRPSTSLQACNERLAVLAHTIADLERDQAAALWERRN